MIERQKQISSNPIQPTQTESYPTSIIFQKNPPKNKDYHEQNQEMKNTLFHQFAVLPSMQKDQISSLIAQEIKIHQDLVQSLILFHSSLKMPKFASTNFSKTIENWHVEISRALVQCRNQIKLLMSDMRGFLGGLGPAFQCWDSCVGDLQEGKLFLDQQQISHIGQNLKSKLLETVLILDAEKSEDFTADKNRVDMCSDQCKNNLPENLESAYNSKNSKNYFSQNTFIGNYTSFKDSENKRQDNRENTNHKKQNNNMQQMQFWPDENKNPNNELSLTKNQQNFNTQAHEQIESKVLFDNNSKLTTVLIPHKSKTPERPSKSPNQPTRVNSTRKVFIYGEDADEEHQNRNQNYQVITTEQTGSKMGEFVKDPSPLKTSRTINLVPISSQDTGRESISVVTNTGRNTERSGRNIYTNAKNGPLNIQIMSPKCSKMSDTLSMIESVQSQAFDKNPHVASIITTNNQPNMQFVTTVLKPNKTVSA